MIRDAGSAERLNESAHKMQKELNDFLNSFELNPMNPEVGNGKGINPQQIQVGFTPFLYPGNKVVVNLTSEVGFRGIDLIKSETFKNLIIEGLRPFGPREIKIISSGHWADRTPKQEILSETKLD